MDPIVLFALVALVVLVVLRIFFKIAKFILFVGLLIVGAIFVWNVLLR